MLLNCRCWSISLNRYFFYSHGRRGRSPDCIERDCENVLDVVPVANSLARQIIADDILSGLLDLKGHIEVQDREGYSLFDVPFREAVSLVN